MEERTVEARMGAGYAMGAWMGTGYASGTSTARRLDEGPSSREDDLLLLGDRIAELARSIQVAEAQLMRLIVEFDRRRGWAAAGFGSCAEWLAWRIGIRPNAARERVRTALALDGLPRTAAAMAAGTLSYSKARSLTRVATPESEEALLAFAHAGSAAHLERVVRAWKAMDDEAELTLEQRRHRRRRFSVFVDDDGSYVVKGRLEPEVGAMLMRAVEAASDALYRREAEGAQTSAARRRADAVGLLAERALAAGFEEGRSGTRAERYQVLLHVEPDTLRRDRESGRSELDGTRVCRETSRRLTCDAGVVRVEVGGGGDVTAVRSRGRRGSGAAADGRTVSSADRPAVLSVDRPAVLSVGRRTRTVPPAVRRALQVRDRVCRFPGCGSRFTDAHHIVHWADGGSTELRNLVLLCRRHHRAVHEGGMRVSLDRRGTVVFFSPAGRAVAGAPAPSGVAAGSGGVPAGSGGVPAGSGGVPGRIAPAARAEPLPPAPALAVAYPGADLCRRDADIPWAVEARAREALDPG